MSGTSKRSFTDPIHTARSHTVSDSIHDEPEGSGSSFKMGALANPNVLKIYQTGELTVVGFGGQDVPDEVCIAEYRQQLIDLIAEHGVKVMAFDLSGVQLVPSGMLGVLSTIAKRVEKVEIYNPSPDVREVLRITKLERLFDIKELQI
jgi:anti-sigma B factor antagonist